jgi:hypothetical protein
MFVRRARPLLLLLAAVTAIVCSAVPAGAMVVGSPQPLPPDQATALATATADVPAGSSSTQSVDGATALNASTLPDAETSIEAGVSPQAAVGLTQLNEASISTTRPVCWANAAWHQWGTWPYQQRIIDTTYWCAVYGSHITYRTSTTTASGTLCGVSWRSRALIAGGVGPGFTYFTNRASAGFSCPTVFPWITIHTTHHEDTKRTDTGATSFVGSG